jgi:glycerophosphoryl diester phosphodiesterase
VPNPVDQVRRPLIIAHRGASAHAPENTLAAFKLALDLGADGVELDAKLTIDGKVVVIHDQTVDRTTGSHGVVREMTLGQLKSLDAGSFFDSGFAHEQIPTLEEVFASIGARTLVNVEITNYTSVGDALPDRICDLVIQYGLQDHIIFSSFHPFNLIRTRRRLPQVPVAILTQPGAAGRLMRGPLGRLAAPRFIHPYFSDVTGASLAQEHRRGRHVNAWTVDSPEEIRRLSRMGIDGIITDDPRLARKIVEEA